jgi:hypothetical protein
LFARTPFDNINMDIKIFPPSEQVDIAVDLGALPPALPNILTLDELEEQDFPTPPIIIEGVLHQGCKMILGGTSKSNKSWSLLDLALSVATGQPWWGRPCTKLPVIYINFELATWSIKNRMRSLRAARPECAGKQMPLHFWNLRGKNADITLLRPQLEERLAKQHYGLIILDPAYKVLGNRDENANGEIADLMNQFEALAQASGAAVIVAHHFAKGDSTVKNAMDRLSGAGAWIRDPDSIMILTPHEEPDCFTVTSILRNLPQLPEFVVQWNHPMMRLAADLNPDALRRPQGRNKLATDKEFMDAVITNDGKSFTKIMQDAKSSLNMSQSTAKRALNRLISAGLINNSGGLYWAKGQKVHMA